MSKPYVSTLWIRIIVFICFLRFMHKKCCNSVFEFFSDYSTDRQLQKLINFEKKNINILSQFLKKQLFTLKDDYCEKHIKSFFIEPNNLSMSRENVVFTPILNQRTYYNSTSKQCENENGEPVKQSVNCGQEFATCKNIVNEDMRVLGKNEFIDSSEVCTFEACTDI